MKTGLKRSKKAYINLGDSAVSQFIECVFLAGVYGGGPHPPAWSIRHDAEGLIGLRTGDFVSIEGSPLGELSGNLFLNVCQTLQRGVGYP